MNKNETFFCQKRKQIKINFMFFRKLGLYKCFYASCNINELNAHDVNVKIMWHTGMTPCSCFIFPKKGHRSVDGYSEKKEV